MKKFNAIMRENKLIIVWFENFRSDFDMVPPLCRSIEELRPMNSLYQLYITECLKTSVAMTAAKEKCKEELIDVICFLAGLMSLYASQNGDEVLYGKSHVLRSDLERFNASKLLAVCEQLLQEARTRVNVWAEMGVTEELLDRLMSLKEEFNESVVEPRRARQDEKMARWKLRELYAKNRKLIYQVILPSVKLLYLKSKPEIVEALKSILNATRVSTRKMAVKGVIVDKVSGEPISYPVIEIEKIGLKRRLVSEFGRFNIQNLEPGEYIIKCSHAEYVSVKYRFIHAWGELTRLQIEMEPVIVEHEV